MTPARLRSHFSSRRRFTLVELLVVVAIISVLAAMLLPVLARAKTYAKDVACANNIRQTAIGVTLYADDNDGHLPIHWGTGTDDSVLRQSTKMPASRWIITASYGKMRAALTWPDYNDGRTFYCPTDEDRNFDMNFNSSTGHGLGHYYQANGTPWTGWGGQFYFSYNFPAIDTPLSRDNSGGAWTGNAPHFWTYPSSGTHHYSSFKNTMLQSRLAANASPMKAMLWDANGVHDYRIANVAYIDGSTLTFRRHQEVYVTDVKASWSRGMSSPWIMDHLTELYGD